VSYIEDCLSGKKLYGDNFKEDEIRAWFNDEREGYANLGAKELNENEYEYNALNIYHGFDHLPKDMRFGEVLGFGSCFGGEFAPIAERIDQLTIIDPSDAFVRSSIFGIPCNYVKPVESGTLPFADASFDLITCFGVLHHIPNVSYVVSELARCLKPGGYVLIREPNVSMGDWRNPRPGLTKRERGLPLDVFKKIVDNNNLVIIRAGYCLFRLIPKVGDAFNIRVYNYMPLVWLDAQICNMLKWNIHYHATTTLQKFCPQSAYFVLQKMADIKVMKVN
jgi:SAM-dependent methyltransferase